MSQWFFIVGLGVVCFTLPNAFLIPLSVAAVMVADTDLLSRNFMHFGFRREMFCFRYISY